MPCHPGVRLISSDNRRVQPQLPIVERFFQFALLGLVASGYLAIAGSGYVDAPTVLLAGVGLIWRAAIISGERRLEPPEIAVTIATVAYMAFAPVDYFFLAKTWIAATVHVVFFVASVKTLTARTARDYLFVAAVAFIELLAAALFSSNSTFFICLSAYLLCAVAALSSSEVRQLGRADLIVARAGTKGTHWRLAATSAMMTTGILLLTAGLFFILPRTANAALRFLVSNRYHLTGFSNDVMLGDVGELKTDSRVVMHVKPLPLSPFGRTGDLPGNLKWRGLALENFDGHRWSTEPAGFRPVLQAPGLVVVADDWQRRRVGRRILYRVDIQNVDADALFVAGIPEFLNIGRTRISRASSGAFRFGFVPSDTLRYEVWSFLGPDTGLAEPHRFSLSVDDRKLNLSLPPLDPRIGALARQMTAGAADDEERARRIERRLRHDYGYSLDLPAVEPRDPIAAFLFERRTGYCTYFASAMAVMLRDLGIPARLVNGFQSGIVNPYSGTLVIRASDAHAWVEAFLPDSGWTVFDPTPSAGTTPVLNVWSKLSLYLDAADTFWREWVLRYDLGQQLTLASRVESQARRFRRSGWMSGLEWISDDGVAAARWLRRWASWLSGAALFMGLAALAIWQLRKSTPVRKARAGRLAPGDATFFYVRMLQMMKRRGYQKPVWFTPQEFAASVPTGQEDTLERFTAAYYAVRFGGDSAASKEMSAALERLSRQ
jgi:transglutaminase-like putative cysteine protease